MHQFIDEIRDKTKQFSIHNDDKDDYDFFAIFFMRNIPT